jgi:Ni/Fe-hydrogenase subunit HybB-like protein
MAFFWVVVIRGNNTPFVVLLTVKTEEATSVVVLTKTDPDKLVKLVGIT